MAAQNVKRESHYPQTMLGLSLLDYCTNMVDAVKEDQLPGPLEERQALKTTFVGTNCVITIVKEASAKWWMTFFEAREMAPITIDI